MDQPPPQGDSTQPPVYPQVVQERILTTPPPPPRKMGFFLRAILFFMVLGFLGSLALNVLLIGIVGMLQLGSLDADSRVQEKFFALNRHGSDKIAILSIEGTILDADGFFKHQIDRALKDAKDGNLKALVVRVDSPGGTISGSDAMLHYLRKLGKETRIPIVVSMGGVAASGGYYVSMCVGDQPNTIFAEPTTWTGSIGVVIPHYNLSELMRKWGIQEDAVASHPLKTMGSFARDMTPEERKIFQALVDEGFSAFKAAIQSGRPKFQKDPEALDRLATGQIFTAAQALENGLIDKIGFIEDAILRAIDLAGLDEKNVKVVKYRAEPRLSDVLWGRSRVPPSVDLSALLEATTPRAYYLCTWLPAIAISPL